MEKEFELILKNNSDQEYRIFSKKLIPDTNLKIIGVRTPVIKKIASEYKNSTEKIYNFFNEKHIYFEESLLHGFLLQTIKDKQDFFFYLSKFIPQIDNWATCDQTVSALKNLNKFPKDSIKLVKECLKNKKPYVVRFGIVVMLNYFLSDNYSKDILHLALSVFSNDYYVNMALAWFYSVALVKQYDDTIRILQDKSLPKFVQNKTIQKANESFRISNDIKKYLKTLKI